MHNKLKIKRIYENYSEEDGYRILVDRIYPRGVKRETAHIDLWLKEIAPSTELRKWFNHEAEKWEEFKARYFAELEENPAVEIIQEKIASGTVTLLYSARDTEHNQAVALHEYLVKKLAE